MAASVKQLAMAWINNCLHPDKINPEKSELAEEVSDEKFKQVVEFIKEDLAKVKPRYQEYCDKYLPKPTTQE